MMINRRSFLGMGTFSIIVPTELFACEDSSGRNRWEQCDPVPENRFRRGTIKKEPDCTVRFQLPKNVLEAIKRTPGDPTGAPGTYDWTLRLITFNSDGSPRWQQAHKVVNRPFKDQGIYFGTTLATYITCDEFTDWWSSGPIRSCVGTVVPQRVNWPFDWEQLEGMTS